jgi:hypothetical protein
MATLEVMKSELDIFSKIQFQKSINSDEFSVIHPSNSIVDSNSIEFLIPGSEKDYIDLQNIYLYIKGKLVKQDGTSFEEGQNDRFSLIPNALFSVWDQISIYLNQTLISQPSNTHPYSTYFNAFLQSSIINESSLNSRFTNGFYITSGDANYDNVDEKYAKIFRKSKEFRHYGRFNGSIFDCEKLLLNRIDLRIILNKASDKFACLGSDEIKDATTNAVTKAKTEPKLKITEASLFVRRVYVSDSIRHAHSEVLSKGANALYPFRRPVVRLINLGVQQNTFHIDNVHNGVMPSKLIVGLTSVESVSGSFRKNPFKFNHFDLTSLNVHFNNELIPKVPYEPDFENDNYQREYLDFFLNSGVNSPSEELFIPYGSYKQNHCLFAFNFNPDFEAKDTNDWISEPVTGFLNIDLKFKSTLSSPLKLVCFMVFDSVFEIDFGRNVFINY